MKLSIIIPAYNEEATIEAIVRRVQAVDLGSVEKEIIVIDDGSSDGTREFLDKLSHPSGPLSLVLSNGSRLRTDNIRVLFQDRNRGKGAAVRLGFQAAQGDVILVQDADLEYDPQQYPALLDPITRGDADVVYGTRFLGGGPHRVLYFWHSVGNKLLTTLSNIFTDLNLSDVWTGYKVFRADVLRRITLREDRFGFEPEITAKIARAGCRIYEVGISYHGRTYEEGKKITWMDAIRGVWCIIRYHWFD